MPWDQREARRAPVPHAGEPHQDGCLVLLHAGRDVATVHPQIDHLQRVRDRPAHSCHCACRRATVAADRGASSPSSPRRARSQSPSASPCRDQLGQPRGALGCASRTQRALAALLPPSPSGSADRDRAVTQGQPSRLAVSAAVARGALHGLPTRRLAAAQPLVHFRVEPLLQPAAHLVSPPRLQVLPCWA